MPSEIRFVSYDDPSVDLDAPRILVEYTAEELKALVHAGNRTVESGECLPSLALIPALKRSEQALKVEEGSGGVLNKAELELCPCGCDLPMGHPEYAARHGEPPEAA